MREAVRRLPLVALAVLAAMSPVGAANPRVTLTVTNATAEEALRRLSEAAGISARLYQQDGGRVPAAPLIQERFTFAWSDVTFARAVREVCERYNLRPSRTAGGYVLYPGFQAPPPAPKRVGLFEKDGIRFYARSVSIYENRQLAFDGGDGNSSSGLQVTLGAELGDGDAEVLAGLQHVVARDDLGNVVGQRGGDYLGSYSDGGLLPDEWTGTVSIPMVHPRAKKLTWLEGDLMRFRKVQAVRVEMALPPIARVTEKRVGDAVFLLTRYQATPQAAAPEEDDALFPRANAGQGGPSMRVRVYTPAGSGLRSRWGGWGMHPYLVTASGRIYTPMVTQSSSGSDGNVAISQSNLTFPAPTDPPAKLVWELVDRSDPVKWMTVRLTDIPLPQPLPFNPAAVRPQPRPGTGEGGGEHPFFERGGGTLLNRVAAPGGAANGTLDLGLAPREGAGFGPVRWLQLEVLDGLAKLESVKPGAYRVVRRFRARSGALPPGEGKWTNEDVQVTLTAGKAAEPAALQWTVTPKAPPKPKR
jgi:hypothetical protein